MDELPTITHRATAQLPTRYGAFTLHVFVDGNGTEHMAAVCGMPQNDCLVRLHSECATGDILGSLRCDCRDQLEQSLQLIATSGHGLLIYLRGHEGRGIGLANKIQAYALQEQGMDTVAANLHLGFAPDARDYAVATAILKHFRISSIKLLTNNPAKISALEKADILVSSRIPLWLADNPHNENYLRSKRDLLRHFKK